MSSIYNRELQESTLFELFSSDTYTDTEKSLKVAIASINENLTNAKEGSWTKKRLTELKKAVDIEISGAYSKTFSALQDETKDIAKIVRTNMLGADDIHVPTKVLEQITNPNRVVQGYGAKELFKLTSDNHARQLKVLIASGVSQGKTNSTIVAELITKNSRLSKAQLKNAVFTHITESRAIVRHNSFESLEKKGVIIGYEYVSTLDSHTSEYCRNHDGRKYYKSIREIQHYINVHFHCRSVFAPLTDSKDLSTKRASMNGQVEDETYSSWFKKQPEDFQKTVLGNKKFNSYKNGSYVIGGLADVVGKSLSLVQINNTLMAQQVDIPDIEKAIEDNKPYNEYELLSKEEQKAFDKGQLLF